MLFLALTLLLAVPVSLIAVSYRRGCWEHEWRRLRSLGWISLTAFWPVMFYYFGKKELFSGGVSYLLVLTALCCFAMLMNPRFDERQDDEDDPDFPPPPDDPEMNWPELERRFREDFHKHRQNIPVN